MLLLQSLIDVDEIDDDNNEQSTSIENEGKAIIN